VTQRTMVGGDSPFPNAWSAPDHRYTSTKAGGAGLKNKYGCRAEARLYPSGERL